MIIVIRFIIILSFFFLKSTEITFSFILNVLPRRLLTANLSCRTDDPEPPVLPAGADDCPRER